MKERVTTLVSRGRGIDREDIQITAKELLYENSNESLLQRRLTFHTDELPPVINSLLQTLPELHVRWASASNIKFTAPFSSRLPPGLHVLKRSRNSTESLPKDYADLCTPLQRFFGHDIKCASETKSFIDLGSPSRHSGSEDSLLQFYDLLPTLEHFQRILEEESCQNYPPCLERASSLTDVASLDIDFDDSNDVLTISALWRTNATAGRSSQRTVKNRRDDKVEVGILETHEPDTPEEIRLGGYLIVLGDEDEPRPTLFSFATRHHTVRFDHQSRFITKFQEPTGLHPKLEISFPARHLKPPSNSCTLHAYLTMPSGVFIDRYQLSDSLFLASQNLISLRTLSGEEDLEAPDWIIDRWGSVALVELAVPKSSHLQQFTSSELWTSTIPMHLRYLAAQENANATDSRVLHVPHPAVFWVCEVDHEIDLKINPFDRLHLGYDHLFPENTIFHHFSPQDTNRVSQISVPVLPTTSADWIFGGTLASVAVGFLWVSWFLLRPLYNEPQQRAVKTAS